MKFSKSNKTFSSPVGMDSGRVLHKVLSITRSYVRPNSYLRVVGTKIKFKKLLSSRGAWVSQSVDGLTLA